MSDTKFTFFKDQWGVHVYYANRDGNPGREIENLLINDKVEFDCSHHCVVPQVNRVSVTTLETQSAGYENSTSKKIISETEYNSQRQTLANIVNVAKTATDMNGEIAGVIKLRVFDKEWSAITKEVDVDRDYEFEVVDIAYPADERLIPLRHLEGEKINYFKVNGETIAVNMLNRLCQEAGLTKGGSGIRQYTMHDYSSNDVAGRIRIEGTDFSEPFTDIKLHGFTGHLQECREYINDVESKAREVVDLWLLGGKTSRGLTVKFLTDHLENIERRVRNVQSKIKTRVSHQGALSAIASAINEIKAIGMQALIDDGENSNKELDNDEL